MNVKENEGKVKNEKYVLIQGWMLKELGLKGNELLIYAIIYGFSQDEKSCFYSSTQYLAEWTNSTRQNAIKVLKKLEKLGYIEKTERHGTTNLYKAFTLQEIQDRCKQSLHVNKSYKGCKQSLHEGVNKSYKGCKQSLHNNTVYKTKDNIFNNTVGEIAKPQKKKSVIEEIKEQISEEDVSIELKNKLYELAVFRKDIKKAYKTYRPIKALINKIGSDYVDERHLMESIDVTIENEYQGVFPTKNYKKFIKSRISNVIESPASLRLKELESKGGVM